MKRYSQTIKIALAVLLAFFANGVLPTYQAYADTLVSDTQPADTAPAPTVVTIPTETTPADTPPIVPAPEVVTPTEEVPVPTPVPTETASLIAPVEDPVTTDAIVLPAVTPLTPTKNDACGASGDTFSVPLVVGVIYKRGSTVLVPGQLYSTNAQSLVTVTASAAPGFTLSAGAQTSFDLTFSLKCVICHRTNSFTNPYVQIEVAESSVDTSSDHYQQHNVHAVFPDTDNDGNWGDVIPPIPGVHNGLNWAAGQAVYGANCNVPVTSTVTPGPCIGGQQVGTITMNFSPVPNGSHLTITGPDTASTQTINQNTAMPIVMSGLGAGTYTVTLTKGNTTLYTTTVTLAACTTTAPAPEFDDTCYADNDWVYIPAQAHVAYRISGQPGIAVAGYHRVSGTVTVTGQATDGYVLTGTTQTPSWTYTFTNKQCLTITKTAMPLSDTNGDGAIGAGDTMRWDIVLTNISDEPLDSDYLDDHFYVSLVDPGTTLSVTTIPALLPGQSVTIHASRVISTAEVSACRITNTASFSAWRINYDLEATVATDMGDTDPTATGSASSTTALECGHTLGTTTVRSTPVQNVLAAATPITATTTLPAELPATGGESNYLVLGVVLSAATYYLMLRRQQA